MNIRIEIIHYKITIKQPVGKTALRLNIAIHIIGILDPVNNTIDVHIEVLPLKSLTLYMTMKINQSKCAAVDKGSQLKSFSGNISCINRFALFRELHIQVRLQGTQVGLHRSIGHEIIDETCIGAPEP